MQAMSVISVTYSMCGVFKITIIKTIKAIAQGQRVQFLINFE